MSYYFSTEVSMPFNQAVERAEQELKKEGFGVLTDIDVRQTLKKKINADYPPYRILGACNPQFAHRALLAENKIGTMLPCNVVVQEIQPGQVEISAIDPMASMQAVENPELVETARIIREKLERVINGCGAD